MYLAHHLTFSKHSVHFGMKQGWSRIGHQLEDLFRRLQQFLTTIED